MEGRVLIFCEGKVDLIFLADIIDILYNYKHKKNLKEKGSEAIFHEKNIVIRELNGLSSLKNQLYYGELEDNIKLKGKNLIFFDADSKDERNGNKGFKICDSKLIEFKKNKSLEFEHYIWPNHEHDGDIEDLLVKLIPEDKKCVFDCINNHQKCLEKTGLDGINFTFELKKLLSYYMFTCNEDSKNEKRDYKNKNIWNFDFEKIEELKRLKDFLDKHLL